MPWWRPAFPGSSREADEVRDLTIVIVKDSEVGTRKGCPYKSQLPYRGTPSLPQKVTFAPMTQLNPGATSSCWE
jgi:hypothetical protein